MHLMDIRRPQPEDVPALVEELWLPFAEEMAEIDPFDELDDDIMDEATSYRAELVERSDVGVWVAEDAGELVGMATVEHQESPPIFARGDTAHIHELYVSPDSRGTGLATELLNRVERWAEDRACEFLSLDVNENNERALAFYREHEFETKRREMVRPL